MFFRSKFRATSEKGQQRGLAIIQRIAKTPPHYRDLETVKRVDPSEYLDARGARAQLYQIPHREAMGSTDGPLNDVTMLGSAIYTSISATCRHRFLAIQQGTVAPRNHVEHEDYLKQLVDQSIQQQINAAGMDPGSTWVELLRMPLTLRPPCAKDEEGCKRVASNYADEVHPVHGIGMLTPLPRITYGMEVTLDDTGLQLLVKHTGLPPENIVAWLNARPAIGVHSAVFEEAHDREQHQRILEHFVSDHLADYERRDALREFIRRDQRPTLRRTTLESHDLRYNDVERNRINFVFGGRLGETLTRSDVDIEQGVAEASRVERQYIKRTLDPVALAASSRVPPHDGSQSEEDEGKARIGVAFPTACTFEQMVRSCDRNSAQAPPVAASSASRVTGDMPDVSWWDAAHKGHLLDRVTG